RPAHLNTLPQIPSSARRVVAVPAALWDGWKVMPPHPAAPAPPASTLAQAAVAEPPRARQGASAGEVLPVAGRRCVRLHWTPAGPGCVAVGSSAGRRPSMRSASLDPGGMNSVVLAPAAYRTSSSQGIAYWANTGVSGTAWNRGCQGSSPFPECACSPLWPQHG